MAPLFSGVRPPLERAAETQKQLTVEQALSWPREANMIRTIIPLLLFAGCMNSSPTGLVNDPVKVTTDKEEYGINESILVTFRNDSDRNFLLYHCDGRIGMWVERWAGSTWVEEMGIHGPPCQAVLLSGTVVLASQDSVVETVGLERAGRYRLKVQTATQDADDNTVSLFSNAFSVGN